MRVGPAYRFLFNSVNMARRQDGWEAATRTALGLVRDESRKLPVQRLRRTARDSTQVPAKAGDESWPEVDVAEVRAQLAQLGIDVIRTSLDPLGLARHMDGYRYPRFYGGGSVASGGVREWKILKYFVSLELVDIRPSDVVIDVASERSLFPDVVRTQTGARVFRQDLTYAPGLVGDRIGGNAARMPIGAEFASKLILHNSFEHFEGEADRDFIREAWRVLRPGGEVCIVPLYLSQRYEILTDPLVDTRGLAWDPGARIARVRGFRNRFGRFYSPAALAERVLRPAEECGFAVSLHDFENLRALDPSSGLHFGLVLTKPETTSDRALAAAQPKEEAGSEPQAAGSTG